MAITLTNSLTTVDLPDQLNWVDEFSWLPVVQAQTFTTTGALYLEHGLKQAGRPITLQGADTAAWCTRALVQTLHSWAAVPNVALSLVLRGVTYSVTFNHEAGALEGLPVLFWADGSWQADDYYTPTVRLITI